MKNPWLEKRSQKFTIAWLYVDQNGHLIEMKDYITLLPFVQVYSFTIMEQCLISKLRFIIKTCWL